MKLGLGLYRRSLTNRISASHARPGAPTWSSIWSTTSGRQTSWDRRDQPLGRHSQEHPPVDRRRTPEPQAGDQRRRPRTRSHREPRSRFWYDVLLDGPKKREQLEELKTLIRRIGNVGIPTLGYNFSIAGVWGHVEGPYARGDAVSVGFLGPDGPKEIPIPTATSGTWSTIPTHPAAPSARHQRRVVAPTRRLPHRTRAGRRRSGSPSGRPPRRSAYAHDPRNGTTRLPTPSLPALARPGSQPQQCLGILPR